MTSAPQPASPSPIGSVPVQVVTTPGCHLCAEGLRVVERVAEPFGIDWAELPLAEVPEGPERDRWSVEVPVLLVDGVQRDFWQIDPRRLTRLLRERTGGETDIAPGSSDRG
ncbi:glutaredoxin family protein [Kocuria sp. JC486]|uniref:Glutaredoxin family protein n=1 Tax=Kocuria soli TaxID=2485125 RepID=A0A3N3ZUS5_9MICC|nr:MULTISPECIES: glutaredoxin family protein [Kocuria]NHU84653.1 glutaredoxin family protein [Kocuria sp. JC486]ROZ65576.1 glutaredoxin family protein [Kocuria soli]